MKNSKKRISKGLIVLNKGERIAIVNLLSIIVILLGFSVLRPSIKLTKKERMAFHNLDSLIAIQEKALQEEQSKAEELAKIATTVAKKPEVQKTSTQPSGNVKKTYPKEVKKIPILDINEADSLALVDLPQIGEVTASRIQRYRNRLGGFVSIEQLFEIKGMDSMRFEAIKPYITLETIGIQKIDINRDDFKALLRHPYLEYEQVKAIVNHRERKGFIKDWKQLREIVGDVNPLLEQYVSY